MREFFYNRTSDSTREELLNYSIYIENSLLLMVFESGIAVVFFLLYILGHYIFWFPEIGDLG